MPLRLPAPIDAYFTSENAHDTAAVDVCFAPDATVHDEGKTIAGRTAIKAWRSETHRKYQHTVEPLALAERDGQVVVTAKVTGNFPGSPIDLQHVFDIADGLIVALRIEP